MIIELLLLVLWAAFLPQPPQTPAAASSVPLAPARLDLPIEVLGREGEIPPNLTPADFTVVVDGEARPVAGLSPLSGSPWRVVIYVDRVLTGSRSMRAAAGTLAAQSKALAALGSVEVVVAEPEPRTALPSTREAPAIDEALSRLWLEGDGRDDVRLLRQRFADGLAGASQDIAAGLAEEAALEEERLVRHQQERLAEWLVRQPASEEPRLLILISDGFDVDPGAFYRSRVSGMPAAPAALEKIALEMARAVAALGWTALALPVGDASLPDLRRMRPSRNEKIPLGVTIPIGRPQPTDGPALPPLAKPFEPLQWLAEASGGEVVLEAAKVPGALARLRSRLRLSVEAPLPADGRPREVIVSTSRNDVKLRARRWDGRGVPEGVGELRARRFWEGEDEGAGLEVVSALSGPGVLELRANPTERTPVEGPLRLTLAFPEGESEARSTRQILTGDLRDPATGNYRVPVTFPEGTDRVAVVVEALDGWTWGGTVVSLTAAPGEDVAQAAPENAPSAPIVRLLEPPGQSLSGRILLRAIGEGEEIARVAFLVAGREAGSCASLPCEVQVDLGRRVREQAIEAVAYAADGRELGRDTARVNEPGGGLKVRIVEPATRKVSGPVDVAAEVRVPGQARIERVEFFWNDELAGTVYGPPYRHRVVVPRADATGYLRVLARLDDGTTAEDAVAVNAAELGDRVDVRLVELFVVVTDKAGKPVRGLAREAFRVRQDGRSQAIAHFDDAGDLPLTMALAIDSSASMFLKLPDVREAVASLLDGGLSARDRALLVDFDTEPRLVRPVTRDLGAVAASLGSLTPDGGTALWEAVAFTLDQLQRVNGRKALVVYSDGIQEDGRISYTEVLRRSRQSGIPIYLIIANPRAARGEDGGFLSEGPSAKLRRLAEATGGRVHFVVPDQDLSGVYGEILSELRSQYTLSFYPEEGATASAWRRVEVEVEGKGLTARTLSGYPARVQ